jgi:AraC family transcriptional regulator, transcriptional activator of pobA
VPGDCFALAPGDWHAYSKPRRLSVYNILFTDQALIGQAGLAGELPAARRLIDGLDAGGEIVALHLGIDERERVMAGIEAILAEAERRRPGYASAMRAQLLLLLVELGRAWSRARGEEPGGKAHPRQREAVEAARAYIEERLADPLTLDAIAAEVGLSSGHLSTLFKRRFAVSPFDYLAKLRLERAKQLLRSTTLGVGAIARAVGFADPSYFARCFHAAVGETPRRFRAAR